MSSSNSDGTTSTSGTKKIAISVGKYGGIITIVLFACQLLEQIEFMP